MKTSNSSWKKQLNRILIPLAEADDFRLAVLGIGNELNGDDSVGVWVARRLRETLTVQPNRLVLDCGTLPENATGPLRRFKPDLVLMVDAADMGEEPGMIREVDLKTVRGFSASSHTLPLSVLADYFKTELSCRVALFCIQPQAIEFDTPLSACLKNAAEEFVKGVQDLLG